MRFLPLFLSTLLVVSQPLMAQSRGDKQVYTLQQCLKITDQKNLDIESARAQQSAASADLTAAFGTFLPGLNANLGFSRRLNVQGGSQLNVLGFAPPPNSYSANAQANLTIFNGFQREANYARAQKNIEVTELSTDQATQRARFETWRRFIAVLRAEQIVKIRRENLDLGLKELERAKARVDAGLAPITVVYSQEADNGTREVELVRAENDVAVAKAELLTNMGLDPGIEADFVESSISKEVQSKELEEFRRAIGSYDAASNRALAKRPDILAGAARESSAQHSLTASRAGYFPSVSAFAGWSWQNAEIGDFDRFGRSFVGFNVAIPIFDNFQTNNQIQSASVQVQQRNVENQQLAQQLRSQVQTAFLNLTAAEKQIEITQRALRAAQINDDSARERFAVGTVGVLDLLTANTQLVNARINKINAVYTYHEATAQMRFVLGDL